MSHNLCRTTCYFCESAVGIEEDPRPVTKEDCGAYFAEYAGMLVARAKCSLCSTDYLAWIGVFADDNPRYVLRPQAINIVPLKGIIDLSFRSTFDDEPGSSDIHWKQAERTLAHLRRVLKKLRREKKRLKERGL